MKDIIEFFNDSYDGITIEYIKDGEFDVLIKFADKADDTNTEGDDRHLRNEFHGQAVCDLESPEKIVLIHNALIGVSCESGQPSLIVGLPVMPFHGFVNDRGTHGFVKLSHFFSCLLYRFLHLLDE